jgi:hypothetical protein
MGGGSETVALLLAALADDPGDTDVYTGVEPDEPPPPNPAGELTNATVSCERTEEGTYPWKAEITPATAFAWDRVRSPLGSVYLIGLSRP